MCRTAEVSSTPNMEVEKYTSRVKSPEAPQEVVAAGAALVEVDETGVFVGLKEAELEVGSSVDGAVDPTVTVTVYGVVARRDLVWTTTDLILQYTPGVGWGCVVFCVTLAQSTVLLPSQLLGHDTGVPCMVAVTHSQIARRRPSSPERF